MKRTPMRRRRTRKPRPDGHVDKAYLAFIRTLPCCAPGITCRARKVDPHHHSLRSSGTAQTAADRDAMPLCRPHHRWNGLHSLEGPFKGWDKGLLRAWQDAQVLRCQALYRSRGGVLVEAT